MSIRRITVQLSGGDADDNALETAFAIAKRFGSHVDALFIWPDLQEIRTIAGEAVWLTEGFEQAASAEAEYHAREARRRFEAARRGACTRSTDEALNAGAPSCRFREMAGPADLIAAEGRLCDLLVLGHVSAKTSARLHAARETAMLTAGRPLLLTPPALSAAIGETIVIAWNGSPEATHAVAGALPFLKEATAVHIVTVRTRSQVAAASAGVDLGERLAEYLALHDVEASVTALTSVEEPVGAAILNSCQKVGADLLVMGCYGHGRMRELILGGVTRHLLANAPLPVLTAH